MRYVGLIVVTLIALLGCTSRDLPGDMFDSGDVKVANEQERLEEEWATNGRCWFHGEILSHVEDNAGNLYELEPEEYGRMARAGIRDACVFYTGVEEPQFFNIRVSSSSWAGVEAVKSGDYYFRVRTNGQRNSGGSVNVPREPKVQHELIHCHRTVSSFEDCGGRPDWEVYKP